MTKYKSGIIETVNGREIIKKDYNKYREYIIEIIPIGKIKDIKLLPNEVKNNSLNER